MPYPSPPPSSLPRILLLFFFLLLIFLPLSLALECSDKSAGPGIPSDCPNRRQYCDEPVYRQLMADQCPMTCGRCGNAARAAGPTATACADHVGPNGLSDCPKFPDRCWDPLWMDTMRRECPLTCGLCAPSAALPPSRPRRILPPPPPPRSLEIVKPQYYDYPALANSINPALRPCDDFYAFVCDGYRKEKALDLVQGGHQEMSHFSENGKKADQMIIDILSKPQFRQLYRDRPLFAKAYAFYDACVDLQARDRQRQRTMGALFEELRRVGAKMGTAYTLNTEWARAVFPLFPVETKVPKFGPQPPLLLPFLIFRPIPFATAKTGQYAANENAFLYELGPLDPTPPPGVLPEEQYQILGRIMSLVMADDLQLNGAAPLLAPAGIGRGAALQQAVDQWIDNFRAMDQQLGQIYAKYASVNSSEFQSLSLRQVHQQLTPSLDWPTFLRDVDPRFSGDTKVMVKCEECFRDLERMIGETLQQNPTRLREYLETYIVLKYSYALDGRFREFTWGRHFPETPQRTSIEALCMARTATHFEKHLDRLYIDAHFDVESQSIVMEMIREIQTEFRLSLEQADWMEQGSRQRALLKFDRMRALVGYFEAIKEDAVLNRENRCYNFGDGQQPYGQMEISASRCTIDKIIGTNVLVDKNGQMLFYLDEYVRSFEPNGLYQTSRNIFIVLAAILQVPFFYKGMPEPIRFGGVGILIAHEITHGFDNRGRRYNEEGRQENWWDAETERKFMEKSQCFVRQYGKYKIRIDDQTELAVDGELTLSENIPDNGGLKAAFRTFRRKIVEGKIERSKKVVRKMEQFTDEQLFFLNFAFSFCSVENGQFLRRRMATDVHSPNPARVNLVTANSQAFHDAFGCREGDKMYLRPSQRCQLW